MRLPMRAKVFSTPIAAPIALGCLLGLSLVSAAPALARTAALQPALSAGAKARRNAAATPTPSPTPAASVAPFFDDSFGPAAKDLDLGLDASRRAEAAARYMHGLMLEDSSDPDESMDEYLKALALDPSNTQLSVKLAWDYLRRSDAPSAINLLKDTIKAAPKSPDAYLALAYLYFSTLNKPDLAQKYALQGLDLDGSNIYAYQCLKEIYKAAGQETKIPALLDRGAKSDSQDAAFWLELGGLYADSLLAAGGAPDPEALKKTNAIFQKALTFADGDPDAVQKVADFYVATQQLALAVPLYQRVIEIDSSRNAARENLARCYLALGQKEQAAATLEDLIKADPVQHEAYEMLAKIYEDAKQYDKAIANYEQSLLVSPRRPEAYESLAMLLLGDHFKQPAKAATVLTEARKRFPDQPWFTFLLAVALSQDKQLQPALRMFEQTMVEAQNVQPALLNSSFYFQYGQTAEQAGLYDRAAELLRKSLDTEDEPERLANTANYLGYMWVDHNVHLDEAGPLIQRALDISPDNGAYLDSMGWYYYHTNQFDKAVAELTRAVELTKPDDPVVYEHLGDTYSKLNDRAKASIWWQKAVELDPSNPNIPELNKKISEAKAAPSPKPSATPSPSPSPSPTTSPAKK